LISSVFDFYQLAKRKKKEDATQTEQYNRMISGFLFPILAAFAGMWLFVKCLKSTVYNPD
jgi:hypothetical protein